jgi:hypothetical protein
MVMRKILILLSICVVASAARAADTQWWAKETICRPTTNKCYTTMGIGYDAGFWDTNNRCWGMKYICGNAIGGTEKTLAGINQIREMQAQYTDFDFALVDTTNRCFGVRKTKDNGTKAMVKGDYVNVFCKGVIDSNPENITNGEITTNYKDRGQPTCKDLADNGWLKVLNSNKCYGKKYSVSDYFIECDKTLTSNTRVIILNGDKNYMVSKDGAPSGKYPVRDTDATSIFDNMITAAKQKHYEKFVEKK